MPLQMHEGNPERRYAVFLSYRHADNKDPGRQWATWLHQVLEGYEIPADLIGTKNSKGNLIPPNLYPVFRDEEELPADADLTGNIRQALENSALLVVLCSPRAVESRFVADEIRYFKELGKADRVLALMIDGEPNASDDPGKAKLGINPEAECLPQPLRYGVVGVDGKIDWSQRTEPIAADARPDGESTQGWTTGAAFREALHENGKLNENQIAQKVREYEQRLELAKLKVIAGALSVPLGVLTERDKAMQLRRARQRSRTLRRWLAAVGVLTLLAIGAALFALQQKKTAQRETLRALGAEQTANEKAAEVVRNLSRADFIAADEAIKAGLNQQALARLARAVRGDPHNLAAGRRLLFLLLQQPWFVPASEGGMRADLSSGPPDPNAASRRASTQAMAAKRLGSDPGEAIVSVSDSGGAVAIARNDKLEWLENSTEPENRSPVDVGFSIKALAFSPAEERIVAVGGYQDEYGHHGDVAVLRDIDSRAKTYRLDRGPIEAVEFSPDDTVFVAAGSWWDADGHLLGSFLPKDESNIRFSADGRVVSMGGMRWGQLGRKPISKAVKEDPSDGPMIEKGEYSPNGAHAVATEENEMAKLIEVQSGRALELPDSERCQFVFTSDSRFLVGIQRDRGGGLVWDVVTAKVARRFPVPAESWVLAASSELALTLSKDETILWNLATGAQSGASLNAGQITGAAFHPDGQRLLLIGQDKNARLWDIAKASWVSESITLPDTNNEATFAPDGSCFATSSCDGGAGLGDFQLWDTETMRPLSKPVAGSEIFGEGGESAPLGSFRFTPSLQLLVSAGPPEGTEKIAQYLSLDVPHSDEPVPGWVADLAEAVAGSRLTANGVFVGIDTATLWKTVAAVRAATERGQDTWSTTIRWWLDETAGRTISPRSSVEVPAYVQRRLASTELHDLVLAGRAAPEKGEVFARLATLAAKDEYRKGIALSASRRARWLGAKPTSTGPKTELDTSPSPNDGGEAEFARGEAFRSGDGVEKNPREAFACYQRAAEMGHVAALHRIGVMFATGSGVTKDESQAVEWYRKAAEKGFAEAQYDLGVRYILGRGVEKNERLGLEWYRKAAAQGWQDAINELRRRDASRK